MSAVTGPISGPQFPPIEIPAADSPFGQDLSSDTIGSTSSFALLATQTPVIPLLEGRITISEYTAAVLEQVNVSRQTLRDSIKKYIESTRGLGFQKIDLGNVIKSTAVNTKPSFAAANQASVNFVAQQNGQVNTMNLAIQTYNVSLGSTTADRLQIDIMNQAIIAYNNNLITDTTFNNAVNVYNAYMTTRNSQLAPVLANYNSAVDTFTSQVSANNDQITNVLNPQRKADGLPPLKLQTSIPPHESPYPLQALAPLNKPVILISPNQSNLDSVNHDTEQFVSKQNLEINTMNDEITTYNNAVGSTDEDASQLATMNTAIADYNNGLLTDSQFNAIVDSYNAYAQQRNSSLQTELDRYNLAANKFQTEVNDNNVFINNNLNPSRALVGLPLLPTQTEVPALGTPLPIQPSAPLTIPVPTLSGGPQIEPALSLVENPSTVVNTGPTLVKTLPKIPQPPLPTLQLLLPAILLNLIRTILSMATPNDVLTNGVDQVLADLIVENPTIAAAFIHRIPVATLSTGNSLQSGGVALSTISGVVSGSPATGAIGKNISNAENSRYQLNLSTEGYRQASAIAAQASSDIALYSALPGIRLIGATGLTSASSTAAFGVAFSITNAQAVSEYINSGIIESQVAQLVDTEIARGVEVQDRQRLSDILSAEIKGYLLNTALLVSSTGTGTPGLGSAVYATATGLAPDEIAGSGGLTTQEVATDNLKSAFLRTTLSEDLSISESINADDAQRIVNSAIAEALAQRAIDNTEDFKQAIYNSFVKQGIRESTAVTLSNRSRDITEAEKTPQGFQNGDLFNQERVANTLAGQLTTLGHDVGTAAVLAKQTAATFFGTAIATNAVEYRISLDAELRRQGLTAEGARKASEGVVATLNVPPSNLSAIQRNTPAAPLSVEAIQTDYYNALVSGLTPAVGPEAARNIANQGISAILGGGQSILTQLNDVQKVRERYGVDTARQTAVAEHRALQSPNIDLYTFSRNLMDPAKSLFMSAATGLTYAGVTIPTNYKRSLDIQI